MSVIMDGTCVSHIVGDRYSAHPKPCSVNEFDVLTRMYKTIHGTHNEKYLFLVPAASKNDTNPSNSITKRITISL